MDSTVCPGMIRFGISRVDPKNSDRPVALTLDSEWFARKQSVVCAYNGTMADEPDQEAATYSYDPRTKSYSVCRRQEKGGRP
jgi:hypothetical protein